MILSKEPDGAAVPRAAQPRRSRDADDQLAGLDRRRRGRDDPEQGTGLHALAAREAVAAQAVDSRIAAVGSTGTWNWKQLPRWLLSTAMLPPCRSRMRLAIARPKPAPPGSRFAARRGTVETIEDERQLGRRDAAAAVAHAHTVPRAPSSCSSTPTQPPDGVCCSALPIRLSKHAFDQAQIGLHRAAIPAWHRAAGSAACLRRPSRNFCTTSPASSANGKASALQGDALEVELGQLEQFVDQRAPGARSGAPRCPGTAPPLRIERLAAQRQQFQVAAHRHQRRAQVVRHVGDQVAAQIGVLGLQVLAAGAPPRPAQPSAGPGARSRSAISRFCSANRRVFCSEIAACASRMLQHALAFGREHA